MAGCDQLTLVKMKHNMDTFINPGYESYHMTENSSSFQWKSKAEEAVIGATSRFARRTFN